MCVDVSVGVWVWAWVWVSVSVSVSVSASASVSASVSARVRCECECECECEWVTQWVRITCKWKQLFECSKLCTFQCSNCSTSRIRDMALYLSLNSFLVYTNFVGLPRLQHSLTNFEAIKSIDRCNFLFLKATFLHLKRHTIFEILCKVFRER